jgi:hypothetical protein
MLQDEEYLERGAIDHERQQEVMKFQKAKLNGRCIVSYLAKLYIGILHTLAM